MKIKFLAAFFVAVMLLAFKTPHPPETSYRFPWKQAGLTERQAAAHLLSRFTYGYTPQMVDELVKSGLENWFQQQLQATDPDDSLNQLLSIYPAVSMTNAEIANHYAEPGKFVKMAIAEGLVSQQQVAEMKEDDKKAYRKQLMQYMQQKGYQPVSALNEELISQKILRAAYSKNQLREVVTGFWFNHFNVSQTKAQSAVYSLSYERDVIRKNALGHFEDLLVATAKSPAMLLYLDNNSSRVNEDNATAKQQKIQQRVQQRINERIASDSTLQQPGIAEKLKARKSQGLNENYAREIMELHTLGVDGGYTQTDVTEAARILTGWMIYPTDSATRVAMDGLKAKYPNLRPGNSGYVHEGDFLFAPHRHDYGSKVFLGKNFPEGRGYEEGMELLNTLATHPSTAGFICKKLAVRFVQDDPPAGLVAKMAKTFSATSGDISAVLITMVSSPEFWNKNAIRQKIKSPFEVVESAIRVTGAKISNPYALYKWLSKMGEPVYSYQAPTGFPDRAQYWVNTGSLLYRMNFGLAFATGKVEGVSYNEKAINQYHEPESVEAALTTYASLLMPERNISGTAQKLLRLLQDPAISQKIEAAASGGKSENGKPAPQTSGAMTVTGIDPNITRQVIGILLGSPEFQRR